ncbi:glycosyltransferase family 9 protein [Candidatus Riflebacteria bacterium]
MVKEKTASVSNIIFQKTPAAGIDISIPEKSGRIDCSHLLIRGTNWLGDSVLSLPAILYLKKTRPRLKLSLIIPEKLHNFFKPFKIFHSIFPLAPIKNFKDELKTLKYLKKAGQRNRFTHAVSFPSSWRSYFQLRAFGVKSLISFHPFCRRRVPAFLAADRHEKYRYFQLLSPFLPAGEVGDLIPPPFPFTLPENSRLLPFLTAKEEKKFIGIFPGSAYGTAKCYPPEKFARVIMALLQEENVNIFLFGSPEERALCQALVGQVQNSKRVFNFAGKISLCESLAFLLYLDVLLCNDSGPMHVAGFFNLPNLALFGSTDLTGTAPAGRNSFILHNKLDCSPCKKRICPLPEHLCMPGIPPDIILQGIEKVVSSKT